MDVRADRAAAFSLSRAEVDACVEVVDHEAQAAHPEKLPGTFRRFAAGDTIATMSLLRTYVIFPDANVLLDLYRVFDPEWTKVANRLADLGDSLIITQQVASEVNRNRLGVVRTAHVAALKELSPPQANLPPGLRTHEQDLRQATKLVGEVTKAIKRSAQSHLQAVALGTDETSLALAHVLDRAEAESEEQLVRARLRKERGNPPGKRTDPLGDQLSWEQLLDALSSATAVIWLVTRDGDYFTKSLEGDGKLLDPVLQAEIRLRAPTAKVRLCEGLPAAINEYLKEKGEAEAFSEAELIHFRSVAQDHDDRREPWECLRDGERTPIESLVCTSCGEHCSEGIGEEDYDVNEVDGGCEISLGRHDDRASAIECETCSGTVFEAEFGSVCSYCTHVATKDD